MRRMRALGGEVTTHRHPELVSGSISPRARRLGLEPESNREIVPMRIVALDQIDLPSPMPLLQLLLASDCFGHLVEHFETDKSDHPVTRGEAFGCTGAMLVQSGKKIRSYANVKRSSRLARKNIGAWLSHHERASTLRAAGWMLKQVQHDGWQVSC